MLRVRVELVPFGDEDRAKELGQLIIHNKGMVEFGHADYGVINMTPGEEGEYVEDVRHRRDLGAWQLVAKAIKELDIKGPLT